MSTAFPKSAGDEPVNGCSLPYMVLQPGDILIRNRYDDRKSSRLVLTNKKGILTWYVLDLKEIVRVGYGKTDRFHCFSITRNGVEYKDAFSLTGTVPFWTK